MSSSRLRKMKRGQGHSYSWDGERFPGVTTILNNSQPKKALRYWYAAEAARWAANNVDLLQSLDVDAWVKQASKAPDSTSKAKMVRGSVLHAFAHQILAGEATDVPPDQEAMVKHVADFLARWEVQEIAAERPCVNVQHKYAGTFDLLAKLRDGHTWLLDYKTGSGVYAETALQLAAYARCTYYQTASELDEPMPLVDRLGVVHVTDDGWELVPIRATVDQLFWCFRACQRVAMWTDWTDGYPTPKWEVIGAPLPKPDLVA